MHKTIISDTSYLSADIALLALKEANE